MLSISESSATIIAEEEIISEEEYNDIVDLLAGLFDETKDSNFIKGNWKF